MKLLGICGSPRKNGNTFQFLEQSMEKVRRSDLEIELVELAGLKIADCNHCNWCLKNVDPARICSQKDDAEEILLKIKAADILVIASPAYYARLTGRLASLLDRTRPLIFSKPHRGVMTDKPGAALTVAWGRNSGSETTLLSILWSFMVLEMLPVSHHHSGALFGAAGITNPALVGADPEERLAVNFDEHGLRAAKNVVLRAHKLARKLQGG